MVGCLYSFTFYPISNQKLVESGCLKMATYIASIILLGKAIKAFANVWTRILEADHFLR